MPYLGPHGDMWGGGTYGVYGYGYPWKPIVGGKAWGGMVKAVSNDATSGLAAFGFVFIGISPSFSSLGVLVVEFHPFTYSSWWVNIYLGTQMRWSHHEPCPSTNFRHWQLVVTIGKLEAWFAWVFLAGIVLPNLWDPLHLLWSAGSFSTAELFIFIGIIPLSFLFGLSVHRTQTN